MSDWNPSNPAVQEAEDYGNVPPPPDEEEKRILVPIEGKRTVRTSLLHLDKKYDIKNISCWRDDEGFHVDVTFEDKWICSHCEMEDHQSCVKGECECKH